MARTDKINELYERRKQLELGGGQDKQEERRKAGKMTARERINALLDEGSFVELDSFVETRSTDFGMQKKKIPGDGVITGYGTIDGRPVCIASQDFTVIGGSLGEAHAKKNCQSHGYGS